MVVPKTCLRAFVGVRTFWRGRGHHGHGSHVAGVSDGRTRVARHTLRRLPLLAREEAAFDETLIAEHRSELVADTRSARSSNAVARGQTLLAEAVKESDAAVAFLELNEAMFNQEQLNGSMVTLLALKSSSLSISLVDAPTPLSCESDWDLEG